MPPLPILQFLTLLILLGTAVFFDVRERLIPNKVTVSGLVAGLVLGTLLEGGLPTEALSGAALALVLAFSIYALGGFGAGDAKLVTAVGAFVGPGGLLSVLVYGALFGGLLALLNAIRRGAIIGLLANTRNLVSHWFTRGRAGYHTDINSGGGHSLPYGVAIAAGAVLAWVFPLSLTGLL
jgi:prepilin peptidase CpaA